MDRRLNSWKEIGAFFGKDERTVKRWEAQRGLPIHRIPGGARTSVYAYAGELERWLRSVGNGAELAPDTSDPPPDPVAIPTEPSPASPAVPPSPATAAWPGNNMRWVLVLCSAALACALIVVTTIPFENPPGSNASTANQAAPDAPPAPPAADGDTNPEAVDLYLNGVYYWNKRTPDSLNRAVHYFNQAIALDPGYAEAYVGLANCYNLLREYTLMPADEAYPRAKAAAERAIALDETLPDAHSALAFVEFYWSRDIPRAQREFERALELDPRSVRAHHWYATALLHMGSFEQSLAQITQAQRLDPESRSILADKGLILFFAGKAEEAVSLLEELADSEPDYLSPHAYLASIHFARAAYEDFLREAKQAARLLQDENRRVVVEAGERGFEQSGAKGMLAAILEEQRRLYAEGHEQAYSLARSYAVLGDAPKALTYLRTAIAKREQGILEIRIDPALASLHSQDEFRALVAEVGMPALE